MSASQNDNLDLRDEYPLYVEIGFVLALALVIGAVQVDLSTGSGITVDIQPQETVDLNQVQQTQHESEPPPPPRPPVPREVPNNTPITQDHNFDTTLEIDDRLQDRGPPSSSDDDPEAPDNEPFVGVEEMPELIGGLKALQAAVEYPPFARRAGIEGKVTVRFVVDKDGNVQNPRIQKGVHELLNEEAIEAVKAQKFEPGRQRGRPVRVEMSLPVFFRLR